MTFRKSAADLAVLKTSQAEAKKLGLKSRLSRRDLTDELSITLLGNGKLGHTKDKGVLLEIVLGQIMYADTLGDPPRLKHVRAVVLSAFDRPARLKRGIKTEQFADADLAAVYASKVMRAWVHGLAASHRGNIGKGDYQAPLPDARRNPTRKDPTVLKRMVVRIMEKGGDLSRAFAIATAQAQRMGFLKAGSRELTAKGRAKEASYTQAQREEAEETLAELVIIAKKPKRTKKTPAKRVAKKTPSRAKKRVSNAPRAGKAPKLDAGDRARIKAHRAPARGSVSSMRPMLAKIFTGMKPGHSYVAEPKIDGYRLLAKRTANGVTLETRTGHKEPYTKNLRVIRRTLERMLSPGQVLDGEILVNDWSGTGLVRKDRLSETEQKALDKNAVFWVFDMPSVGGTYKERRKALVALDAYRGSLRLVPSVAAVDAADANRIAKKMAAAGYEGAIIKDIGALYSPGKRTDAFTKIKFKHDITATITGFIEGEGKNKGSLGALKVRADGRDFKVGTGLSDALRDEIWRNQRKYKGKKIEVTAQKDGAKLKLPRFPAFVRFRGSE